MLELFAFIFLVGLVTVAAILIYAVMVYSQTMTEILDNFHLEMLRLQGRLNTPKENQDGTERLAAETTQQENKH